MNCVIGPAQLVPSRVCRDPTGRTCGDEEAESSCDGSGKGAAGEGEVEEEDLTRQVAVPQRMCGLRIADLAPCSRAATPYFGKLLRGLFGAAEEAVREPRSIICFFAGDYPWLGCKSVCCRRCNFPVTGKLPVGFDDRSAYVAAVLINQGE